MSETDNQKRAQTAKRISEARKSSGLSQGQVAKLMDLHRPTISEIEAGNRRVTAEELSTFAKLFDVTVGWLLGESSETIETDDPRVQLAARELKKLKPEDLDRLMRLLASMRSNETPKAKRGGKS